MYNVETVESLHAYAGRLHRDWPQVNTSTMPRRSTVRSLVRRIRLGR